MGDLNYRSFVRTIAIALVAGALGLALPAIGAETQTAKERVADTDADLPAAPVEIDGHVLFRVRGTSVLPAEKRAAAIVGRIEMLAADVNVPVEAVRAVESKAAPAFLPATSVSWWSWMPTPNWSQWIERFSRARLFTASKKQSLCIDRSAAERH